MIALKPTYSKPGLALGESTGPETAQRQVWPRKSSVQREFYLRQQCWLSTVWPRVWPASCFRPCIAHMSKPASTEMDELISGLNRLARNLWWTWSQESQEIFQELSPRGWQNLYHNAVAVLHEVSDYELRVRLQDHEFAQRVRGVLKNFETYLSDKNTWGHQNAPAL